MSDPIRFSITSAPGFWSDPDRNAEHDKIVEQHVLTIMNARARKAGHLAPTASITVDDISHEDSDGGSVRTWTFQP